MSHCGVGLLACPGERPLASGQRTRSSAPPRRSVETIQPARYTCHRAAGPIAIDGRLDEPSWQLAPKSTPFVDIVTGEPAWFDTRVAMLWDDDYLYFGFWAEETDVWGTLTERDSKIYEENDLEIFIAGDDT